MNRDKLYDDLSDVDGGLELISSNLPVSVPKECAMSYYEISFPCLAENLCHIKLPLKFYEDSSSYLVSHYIRSTNGEDDEVAADNEIHNLTDILEKNNVPYELSDRGMAVDARSNFRTFFYPHFPKGSNGTLKMTVDYYDYESNPSSIEDEAKKYFDANRRDDMRW